jgi:hypothetical protein
VTAVLEAAIEAGVIVPQPAPALAQMLIGALDEGAMLVARADDRDAAREEVYEVMDRLLAALATDESGPARPS